MPDVEVRSWSEVCHAAYVFDGDPLGRFVGTAATRPAALRLGRKVLREFGESPLTPTVSGRVSGEPNDQTMGELGPHNRIGRAGAVNTRTPDLTSNTGRLPQ